MPSSETISVLGAAVVYRLFDVGYQVQMEQALEHLASSAPARVRPVRGEARALQILNPPIAVDLGSEPIVVAGREMVAEVSARIFDFGVVALRARLDTHALLSWRDFTAFGTAVDANPDIPRMLERHLHRLVERMGDAIERPHIAPVREDYIVYRIRDVRDSTGPRPQRELVEQLDLVPLLLNESRPLSTEAQRELLQQRFSYYADDLAILTWDNALIIDPDAGDSDVEYVLEFANAQFLELRYYDAVLDAELPRLYDRVEYARGRRVKVFRTRYGTLLGSMQSLVADTTEVVERAENAFKVTDDVYLARIYSAALEIFRGRTWRAGIDRKLTIIRETYGMLNDEAQALRAEALEVAIVALIVFEIVLSLLG